MLQANFDATHSMALFLVKMVFRYDLNVHLKDIWNAFKCKCQKNFSTDAKMLQMTIRFVIDAVITVMSSMSFIISYHISFLAV